MNSDQVRSKIARRAEAAGSLKAIADEIGVSPAYLNDVMHGRREPGKKILKGLGLTRVLIYRESEA